MRPVVHGVVAAPVAAKSPLAAIVLSVSGDALLFLTVTVFEALVVPAAWVVKVSVGGVKVRGEAEPPLPVPESGTSCGE